MVLVVVMVMAIKGMEVSSEGRMSDDNCVIELD